MYGTSIAVGDPRESELESRAHADPGAGYKHPATAVWRCCGTRKCSPPPGVCPRSRTRRGFLPMLRRVLGQASVELGQIELFAVVAGPGSFTGLRVGLAAVKGWAEVLGRPIAAVSGLEAVAVQAQGGAHVLAAAIDARGGQLFGGMFRREGADGRLVGDGRRKWSWARRSIFSGWREWLEAKGRCL